MPDPRKLLIIGSQPHSLGAAIEDEARRDDWWKTVWTAGISGHEREEFNVLWHHDKFSLIRETKFTDVICTVGINLPDYGHENYPTLDHQLMVNAYGPIRLAQYWAGISRYYNIGHVSFVAISSNSAHVPRSTSVGYCASKAALSMGLRCLGRQYAKETPGEGAQVRIWGYEPGYIFGTPMSKEKFGISKPNHRMPDGRYGLYSAQLASRILDDVWHHSSMMMATMQRIDAGDM